MRTRVRMSHGATGAPATGAADIAVTPIRTGADRTRPVTPQHPD